MRTGPNAESDVKGDIPCAAIPEEERAPVRLSIKRTMKQLTGPYSAF